MLCARALETWFGDLSATTRRLALRREVRARPAPREGTRPFLARSGKSLSSPAAHASLPLPLPPYPVLACDTLRPHAPRLSPTLAGGRIYPPCHSMHDHRWGQRCSCDCGFGLTSRPLACSCTPHGAVLEPPGGLGRSLAVCHCREWQARSGASEHAFGRRECQKQGTREESPVCFPVWDAGYAEISW